MLRALPGTTVILLTIVLLGSAFAGVGLLVRRAFGLRELDLDDLWFAFWAGFGVITLFLLVWNFFLPVGASALWIVLGSGAAGLFRSRRELREAGPSVRGLPSWTAAAVLAAGLWIANRFLGSMVNWDSALYHMQGVEWARQYRVVPGLANLFGPLGFNNSSLLYDALLSVGPWAGRSWHIANAVLVFVLAAQSLCGGAQLLAGRAARHSSGLFAFLLLAATLDLILEDRAASFVTDVPQTAVRLALIALWYRALIAPARPALAEAYDLVSLVLLAATIVSIKMNAVVFSAAAVAAASAAFLRGGRGVGVRRRTIAWSAAVALAYGLAWSGRGVVLSGYPLFPSRILGAPVSWRAPAEHADAEFDYIVHSGRATVSNTDYVAGRVSGMAVWLPRWITRVREEVYYLLVPLLMSLVTLPLLLMARRRAGAEERRRVRPAWWILLPNVVALVTWFAVAPEPRYATPIAWAFTALLGAQAFALAGDRLSTGRRRLLLGVVAAIGVSPLAVNPLLLWSQAHDGNPLRAIARGNLNLPPRGTWLPAQAGHAVLHSFTTSSGLVLQVPDRVCWNAPLPCTPNPASNLRLRVPGRLDGGFVVDGPWAMQNWPEKWRPDYLPAWRAGRQSARSRPE